MTPTPSWLAALSSRRRDSPEDQPPTPPAAPSPSTAGSRRGHHPPATAPATGAVQGRRGTGTAARRRDRKVYLYSHPLLFGLLAATRGRPVTRLGRTVIAHSRAAFTDGLIRVPLDRTAEGTTGGAAGRLTGGGLLFDQEGDAHRGTRRSLADALSADGVARLRPTWTAVLHRRLAPLATGGRVDLVEVAAELAGTTAAALLDLDVDAHELARAARAAAAAGAREHLPGLPRPGSRRIARRAAGHLNALIKRSRSDSADSGTDAGLAAMLAVAAVSTTVAALPRVAAWCADAGLWGHAESHPAALTAELLRVTAPTPLLPRVAAGAGRVTDCPVRRGDRLILVTRHAVDAHHRDPSPEDPAPPQVSQLVFGAGPHACPGARLAREQITDTLTALAAYRPVVVTARVDRRSALPGWSTLIIRATR